MADEQPSQTESVRLAVAGPFWVHKFHGVDSDGKEVVVTRDGVDLTPALADSLTAQAKDHHVTLKKVK